MNCRDLEELLSAYADGELGGTQRDFIEEHLASCADCRAILADSKKTREQLLSLRAVPPIPDIKQAIMLKIKMAEAPAKLRRWLRPALVGVPIIVILVTVLALYLSGSFSGYKSVFAKACAATEKIESYRMIVDLYEQQYFYSEDELDHIWCQEYEYSGPESYHRTHYNIVENSRSFFNETIVIGDQEYYRGKFIIPLSASQFAEATPSKEYTLELLNVLIDIEAMPDENIDGTECYHYHGTVDVERLWEWVRPMTEEMIKKSAQSSNASDEDVAERLKSAEDYIHQMETSYELWIGKNDYLFRQTVNITKEGPNPHLPKYISIVKYYDFNEPITIEPPLTESGELLEGWRLAPKTWLTR